MPQFALCIVVQHQHHQPSAVACPGVLQHLSVTCRVAKRCIRTAANLQVNTFGLSCVVIVQEQLRVLREERLTILVVACARAKEGNSVWPKVGSKAKPEIIVRRLMSDEHPSDFMSPLELLEEPQGFRSRGSSVVALTPVSSPGRQGCRGMGCRPIWT
jgi:hypothetical protein